MVDPNAEPIWFNKEDKNQQKRTSVFIATPCHSDVSMHYTQSLLLLQKMAFARGVGLSFQLFKSSLVTQGRNLCVAAFLNDSKSTHLLFVDSDIAFKPESLFNLLKADKDVISVPYPLKDINWAKAEKMLKEGKLKTRHDLKYKGFYRYPFKVEDNNNIKVNNGVIEVTHSPTGFMLIKREVIEKMIEHYGEEYEIVQENVINGSLQKVNNLYNFFDTMHVPENKHYIGEDFAFCKRWKAIGGKCHAYVMDEITHVGEHQYTGRFMDELIYDK